MSWLPGAGVLGLIAEAALKSTAVLAPALLIAALSKRRPAAYRHFILTLALSGLLLLPFLSLAPFGWRTALLPAPPPATATEVRPARAAQLESSLIPDSTRFVPTSRAAEFSAAPQDREPIRRRPGTAAGASRPAPPVRTDPETGPAPSGMRRILNLVLAAVWSVGAAFLVLRIALGLAAAARLTKEGTSLGDPGLRILVERFCALFAFTRPVRLKGHPRVVVPLTWGWRKPVVLMPADARAWSAEERSSALLHELSHVKRADYLVLLAVRASLALFWFNPLCWIVYHELRKEQEIACDELVLRAGIKPSTYAASLLAFRRAAGVRMRLSAAFPGMLGNAFFHDRLAAILERKLPFKEVMMKTRILLAAAILLSFVVIGTARPAGRAEELDAAVPAPDSLACPAPAGSIQEQAAAQEKEKEKGKKVTVEAAKAKTAPIVITITKGGEVKTLTLDKPLTISKLEDSTVLVLTSEGKEIKVVKGEPLRLEIKSGDVQIVKEGHTLKVGEGGVYTIVRESEKDGHKVVLYGPGEMKVVEPGKVQVVKKGDSAFTWTVQEPGKDGVYWMNKEVSGKPASTAVWVGEGGKAFAVAPSGTKELLEKVRALREQAEAVKAKKMDITALEESLKALEAELQAKEDKLKELEVKLEKIPRAAAVAKAVAGGKAEGRVGVWISEGDTAKVVAESKDKEDRTIHIIAGGKESSREDYDRALARLKKELPEGYTLLDSSFDEETGMMVVKIAPPEGEKRDPGFVRKLVDALKDEIKTKK